MPDLVVIGFDFGLRSIGVAVGQSITQSATPLTAIPAEQGQPDWQLIQTLIDEWHPHALLVGMPLNMDGSAQPIGEYATTFIDALAQRFKLPVHAVDERLTTKSAREQLFAEGGYKALNKGAVDSLSAKLIVEQWLVTQESF